MNTYSNDPNHWSNRYPWNRNGTAIRAALEQFLRVTRQLPEAELEQRKAALDWLWSLLDKGPRDLFP